MNTPSLVTSEGDYEFRVIFKVDLKACYERYERLYSLLRTMLRLKVLIINSVTNVTNVFKVTRTRYIEKYS